MKHQAFLSLGSNLGKRANNISHASMLIDEIAGEILQLSSIEESEAAGFNSYPFLNQVIKIKTDLSPNELLEITQKIEKILGREHKTNCKNEILVYEDRIIDIDILFYDDVNISNDRLTIPHPRIYERKFIYNLLNQIQN